jgi:hypothetical protein
MFAGYRSKKPEIFFSISRFSAAVTAYVIYWSEFLAANIEVPGSIPGATRFSAYQWVWNGIHSAS